MAQLKSTSVTGNISVTGNMTASNIVKIGGSSSQILMADGSVLEKSSVGSVAGVTAGTGLTGSATNGVITLNANLNSTSSLGTIGTTSKLYAIGVDANGQLCVSVPWQNTTSIPTRLAESSTSGYSDADSATIQGWHYMSSTGTNKPPFKQVDGQTGNDYRIMTTAYGSTWLQQIATDFRSNDIFTRRCQSGTWQGWTALVKMQQGLSSPVGTDNAIARWDSGRNATIQDSLVTIDDNGVLNAPTLQEGGTSLANKYQAKGTYLTSHQTIYNLTLKGAGTTVTTFDPNGAANSLDIVAGTNVTITPDATNKKITIAASVPDATYSTKGIVYICATRAQVTTGGTEDAVSAKALAETLDYMEYATEDWVTQNFVKKCLLEGTMITMADGTRKPIEEVVEGDLVKSIDIETGKETQAVVLANPVGDVENYYFMMMFEDGSSLKTNWTHDIYNATKGTWAKSDCDMYLDDEVIKEDGSRAKFIGTIDTIGTTNGRRCKFYDIVVSNNCYYADGILCATNPISQYRWLVPALNKYANEIPEELKGIIATYRDEDTREADLVHNNEYMAHYIKYMGEKMKKEAKLRALKYDLANTDYITLKVSEGVEITPEIQEKLDARAWWRSLYNEYEAELNVIYDNINKLKVKYSPLGEDILLDNISLRRKFFLESCRKANANLNKFKNYYRNSDKFQVGY